MRSQTKVFTVHGRGPFPLDMLRYDGAWPYSTQDAVEIGESFDISNGYKSWEVKLCTNQNMSPTEGRWSSFNCGVCLERY